MIHEEVASGPPGVNFGAEEADRAGEAWRFNCAPGAICAVTGLKPEELRPHLLDFESKGYTNPTLMWAILKKLGLPRFYQSHPTGWPNFGLVRIQWAGPWTAPGVPMRVRYRKTHWVACWRSKADSARGIDTPTAVFDINAIDVGGWISFADWSGVLVPWLLKECEPEASGKWWVTHAISIPDRVISVTLTPKAPLIQIHTTLAPGCKQ